MARYFMPRKARYYCLLFLIFTSVLAYGQRTVVAVAANFDQPIRGIAREFEKKTGQDIQIVLGSSGKLFAQIKNGAPYDVFLSADQTKPAALAAQGFGVLSSQFTYAKGLIVLWSRRPLNSSLSIDKLLVDNKIHSIAMANPTLAPYGTAAKEVIEQLGLQDKIADRLVFGQNIAQAYHFVYSGNAEVGFVAHSQFTNVQHMENSQGVFWEIPRELYTPIAQDAILLSRAKNKTEAKIFLEYLKTENARRVMSTYGYYFDSELP